MSCESTTTDFDFCTNLLIMSPSGFDVLQQKEETKLATWGDIQGLCKHLEEQMTKQSAKSVEDVNAMQLELRETIETVKDIQTQMTACQNSINQLTQAVEGMHVAAQNRAPDELLDDDSVFNDNAALLGHGRGGAPGVRGRGNQHVGARRVPLQ